MNIRKVVGFKLQEDKILNHKEGSGNLKRHTPRSQGKWLQGNGQREVGKRARRTCSWQKTTENKKVRVCPRVNGEGNLEKTEVGRSTIFRQQCELSLYYATRSFTVPSHMSGPDLCLQYTCPRTVQAWPLSPVCGFCCHRHWASCGSGRSGRRRATCAVKG